MEILRKVKCSERLPEKEGKYHTVENENFETMRYFNGNRFEVSQYDIIEYWYEPITIELDSEKILAIEFANWLPDRYIKMMQNKEIFSTEQLYEQFKLEKNGK